MHLHLHASQRYLIRHQLFWDWEKSPPLFLPLPLFDSTFFCILFFPSFYPIIFQYPPSISTLFPHIYLYLFLYLFCCHLFSSEGLLTCLKSFLYQLCCNKDLRNSFLNNIIFNVLSSFEFLCCFAFEISTFFFLTITYFCSIFLYREHPKNMTQSQRGEISITVNALDKPLPFLGNDNYQIKVRNCPHEFFSREFCFEMGISFCSL